MYVLDTYRPSPHTWGSPNYKIIVLPLLGQLVTEGLLVGLGLLLLLGFLSRLMFLNDLGCLKRLGEPGLHLIAILVPMELLVPLGLLVQLGFLVQVGLRYKKITKLDSSISYHT